MVTPQQIANTGTDVGGETKTGADIVVETLEVRGVTRVVGVPGAKDRQSFRQTS
jgi:hypothetical protein